MHFFKMRISSYFVVVVFFRFGLLIRDADSAIGTVADIVNVKILTLRITMSILFSGNWLHGWHWQRVRFAGIQCTQLSKHNSYSG